MAEPNDLQVPPEALGAIERHLAYLKLSFIAEQYADLAKHATHKAWSHVDYLAKLLEGEVDVRHDRATESRSAVRKLGLVFALVSMVSAIATPVAMAASGNPTAAPQRLGKFE